MPPSITMLRSRVEGEETPPANPSIHGGLGLQTADATALSGPCTPFHQPRNLCSTTIGPAYQCPSRAPHRKPRITSTRQFSCPSPAGHTPTQDTRTSTPQECLQWQALGPEPLATRLGLDPIRGVAFPLQWTELLAATPRFGASAPPGRAHGSQGKTVYRGTGCHTRKRLPPVMTHRWPGRGMRGHERGNETRNRLELKEDRCYGERTPTHEIHTGTTPTQYRNT